MILVDSSMWIALLNAPARPVISAKDLVRFVTCGPVLQEVLQGLRDRPEAEDLRQALLALPCLSDPLPLRLFVQAAEIFRLGRRRGYTVRSAVDCLIAAVAIDNHVPVWHQDRDFALISSYTPLECWPPAPE